MDKKVRYFFILFLIAVIFFSFSIDIAKRQRFGFFSDESSYFSVIQSLAFDYDLEYKRKDINRIREYFPGGPMGLFLKKTKDGKIFFAKSYIYPLFVAPFFRVFGLNGILLFNGLLVFFAVFMGYKLLNSYHSEVNSLIFSSGFVLATVLPIYIWWMTADLFNFFVLFAALFFFFYPFKNKYLFFISPFFFSLSALSKPYNVFAIGIIYLILLYRKEWKKFIIISIMSIILFGVMSGFYCYQTGEWNYKLFMGGNRKAFHGKYPFEFPEDKEGNIMKGVTVKPYSFEDGFKMSFDDYWERFYISPKVIILNLFYFIFGRFTGIFIYFFPAVFVFLLFFFQRKVPSDIFVLLSICVGVLTYLILAPDNYFGGSGSVGNRYFLNIFPLFFFLGFKKRIFKFSLLPFIIALVFLSGTYVDANHRSSYARYTGISFPVSLFPPEKTQYDKLPTNENPRAFGKYISFSNRQGQPVKYWIYFLNDNYHKVEENKFWTNADSRLEFFLATKKPVKKFYVRLWSKIKRNKFSFRIENKTIEGKTGNGFVEICFKNIKGLKMKNRFVYYLSVKSDNWISPRFEHNPKDDKRKLGVFSLIEPVY